jgi:hypothetical protein
MKSLLETHAMASIFKDEPWGSIEIDDRAGRIHFRERWLYNFFARADLSAWTEGEKRRFHRAAHRQIARIWNRQVRLTTSGAAPFARKHRRVPVAFEIFWVTRGQHWTVNVRKMPQDALPGEGESMVNRRKLQIDLQNLDVRPYPACNEANGCRKKLALPHEFVHTFPGVRDEYGGDGIYVADTDSIANIGREVRERHVRPLLDSLNTMIPDCRFSM